MRPSGNSRYVEPCQQLHGGPSLNDDGGDDDQAGCRQHCLSRFADRVSDGQCEGHGAAQT